MKTIFLRLSIRALTLSTVCIATFSTAFAQSDNKPENRPNRQFPRGERPAGGFQPGAAMGAAGHFLPFLERVLTEEQRTSLRNAMEQQREQVRSLEQKLQDARRDLLKASVVEKFDEDSVRNKALEVAKLDAEMTVLRAKAFSQMKPPLSPDQLEQLRNAPRDGGENRGDSPAPRRDDRKPVGPRDENDLPLPPKADK